jgi:hypothetical protein
MKTHLPRPHALAVIEVIFGVLWLSAAVGGFVLIQRDGSHGAPFELGKWLLQIATVFLGAGLITLVLRQVEIRRSKRESWTAQLQDLVTGQDAVETAAVGLHWNPTAMTYTKLIESIKGLNASLRRMIATPDAHEKERDLRRAIQAFRSILKDLVKEYEIGSLSVLRQQMLDDKLLEVELERLVDGETLSPNTTILPDPLLEPTGVGRLLRQATRFPSVNRLLRGIADGKFDKHCEFEIKYHDVKTLLEKSAGVRRVL